jgi:cytochrome P450
MSDVEVITVTTVEEAKEVYRQKDFRQALYDAGEIVMSGVLVNLHGDEHRSRRRLENRLFRRDTLVHYERDLFPATIEETLKPYVAQGHAELVHLSHQLMMNLAALNAGVDRPLGTPEETARLYAQMMKFIEGATLLHSTRDHEEVKAEIREALAHFDEEFLHPSIARRQAMLADLASGELTEDELPRDVLTILLRNEDALHLPPDVIQREIAFFLLAGAHTSATAFVRTINYLLQWIAAHPEDEDVLHHDRGFVQRAVHETVRLNPSSPVGMRWALAPVTLRSGRHIPEGAQVVIDLLAVNRDPEVFGPDADDFNPHRQLGPDAPGPWGLSFGQGMHACIGQELAAGLLQHSPDAAEYEYGLVTVAVQAMFDRRVHLDPEHPPEMDLATKRPYWGSYPVLLG